MNRCHLRAPRRSLAAVIAAAAVLAITGVLAFAFALVPLARDTPADLVHAYEGYWNGVDQQMTQITQARQQDGRTP